MSDIGGGATVSEWEGIYRSVSLGLDKNAAPTTTPTTKDAVSTVCSYLSMPNDFVCDNYNGPAGSAPEGCTRHTVTWGI
jgi:hypothetical protein